MGSTLVRMLTQGVLGMFRLCSGSTPAYSHSAQVKAAVAHVRRLKRNQRKGKSILSLWEFHNCFTRTINGEQHNTVAVEDHVILDT
jgi:hypothetical protein